jgi:hypothetical protein
MADSLTVFQDALHPQPVLELDSAKPEISWEAAV